MFSRKKKKKGFPKQNEKKKKKLSPPPPPPKKGVSKPKKKNNNNSFPTNKPSKMFSRGIKTSKTQSYDLIFFYDSSLSFLVM